MKTQDVTGPDAERTRRVYERFLRRRGRIAPDGTLIIRPMLDPALRERLSEAQNHRCCYCGTRMTAGFGPATPTFDHIVPIVRGGGDEISNLAIACSACNSRRGDRPALEFLRVVQSEIEAIRRFRRWLAGLR